MVDTESTPPRATLVDATGVAVDSTEIVSDSESAAIKDWATQAAQRYEETLAQKQAESTAANEAIAKAESLKSDLEAEVITI